MGPKTLQFKVGLYLTIALTVAMLAFTSLVVWHQRQELLANVADRVTQISEVITKSTRYAMLQNRTDAGPQGRGLLPLPPERAAAGAGPQERADLDLYHARRQANARQHGGDT